MVRIVRDVQMTKEQLAEYELRATMAERDRCAKIVRRICGETLHVTLGDQIERAIDAGE